MKTLLILLIALGSQLSALSSQLPDPAGHRPALHATDRDSVSRSPRPYYQTIPGWKRLWLPIVPWDQCPVTPDKMVKIRGPLGNPSAHNPATGRY